MKKAITLKQLVEKLEEAYEKCKDSKNKVREAEPIIIFDFCGILPACTFVAESDSGEMIIAFGYAASNDTVPLKTVVENLKEILVEGIPIEPLEGGVDKPIRKKVPPDTTIWVVSENEANDFNIETAVVDVEVSKGRAILKTDNMKKVRTVQRRNIITIAVIAWLAVVGFIGIMILNKTPRCEREPAIIVRTVVERETFVDNKGYVIKTQELVLQVDTLKLRHYKFK